MHKKLFHLGIAIPTYNRITSLKKCIESICDQKISKNIKVSIIVSNISSTDSTAEYLESLRNTEGFYINDKLKNIEKSNVSQFINFESLSNTIPANLDWIWWLGDDDKLSNKNSIEFLIKNIIKNDVDDNLVFVHPCQKGKSTENNIIVKDTIFNLCNLFGFHEILGWMSSIVLKTKYMKEMLIDSSKNKQFFIKSINDKIPSAFSHAESILRNYGNRLGLFIDSALVEPQDKSQSQETIKRWKKENVMNRYFMISSELMEIKKIFSYKISRKFLRYNTYHFWDHCIYHIFMGLLSKGRKLKQLDETFNDDEKKILMGNWDNVLKFSALVDNPYDKKNIKILHQLGVLFSLMYINSNFSEIIIEQNIQPLITKLSIPTYCNIINS